MSVTTAKLASMKAAGEQIVMVTAYDFPSARAAEKAGVDMVLVGDSGANVVLGYDTTAEVSMDEMLMMAAAARRGTETAFLVCDVPFGSTEVSDEQAVETAVRFVKEAGADAVKLEGGNPRRLSRIRAIVDAGIPVVAHVGLTPQTAVALGGMRAQGRTAETASRFVREMFAVQEAGAFCVVVEAVPADVVGLVLEHMQIPVIGIGAGVAHGQVLVQHDLLGITEGRMASFVKSYARLNEVFAEGIGAYADEVRSGAFPAAEHCYKSKPEALEAARAEIDRLSS